MSAVLVNPVDRSFKAMLLAQTGRPVELGDTPEDQTLPFIIVYPMPSTQGTDGPWGDPYGMATLVYQLSLVGEVEEQVELLEDRVTLAIAEHHQEVTGCMGPPDVRRGGIVRDDERLYRGVVHITMRSTA